MKTLGRDSRRMGWRKPRRRVRRTEPLPKMCVPQYTLRQKQQRTAENAQARTLQSACPTRAGNLVLEPGGKQVFREVTVGWAKHMDKFYEWCLLLVSPQVQRWPCGLAEHSNPQLVRCALPPLRYSTQHLRPSTGRNSCSCGHHHGWPVPGAASLPCSCGRCHSKLTA